MFEPVACLFIVTTWTDFLSFRLFSATGAAHQFALIFLISMSAYCPLHTIWTDCFLGFTVTR